MAAQCLLGLHVVQFAQPLCCGLALARGTCEGDEHVEGPSHHTTCPTLRLSGRLPVYLCKFVQNKPKLADQGGQSQQKALLLASWEG